MAETHDFMNVESFSQLPFIRPSGPSPRDRPGGIRLFGIEFGGSGSSSSTAHDAASVDVVVGEGDDDPKDSESASESGRKFECHYCCRNFPTSQALGGHQNAHKRERQHAKRAHLQSTLLHADAAAHMYGGSFINYHQHHRFGHLPPPPPVAAASLHYPSWSSNNMSHHHHNRYYYASHNNNNNNNNPSFSQTLPINGNPLATWRIPTMQSHAAAATTMNRDRTLNPLPLFGENQKGGVGVGVGMVFEGKNRVQDQVSLDLHL